MSILLIHLSDVHVQTGNEPIFQRWDSVCRTAVSELDSDVSACVIVFGGDAAYAGKEQEYAHVAKLLSKLKDFIKGAKPNLPVYTLTVPGNHDCDFSSEDQDARLTLREKLSDDVPADSTARVLLEPQREYFKFSANVGDAGTAFSFDAPYYKTFDLISDEQLVRFHLLNSSWTSKLHETDDLRFPLKAFTPPSAPTANLGIAIIHHPVHWFLMPTVRRELRDSLENYADMILTGHEHENEASLRMVRDGPTVAYQEGGVLNDPDHPEVCTFNIVRLEIAADKQAIRRYRWANTHFEMDGEPDEGPISRNLKRADQHFRLHQGFELWLDELEDPLTHPRENDLRLSHLFAYPELRKLVERSPGSADPGPAETVERIRSEDVVAEISRNARSFITGGDKAGKTCLLKRVFVDLHHACVVPLFLKGSDIAKSGSEESARRAIAKAVAAQYQTLTASQFEQLAPQDKVLLIDDFQDGPVDPKARRRVIDYFGSRFGVMVVVASDDLYLELVDRHGEDALALLSFQRYEISDFGGGRLEELALRWTSLGRNDTDPTQLRIQALELTEKVQNLIAVAGLPHTPWLLVVVLEHDESPDATVAAKNGDYGHLYHAIITIRLARSKFTRFNLNGKFSYLAELAYHLYKSNKATLNNNEARAFHASYSERFDLTFDFEKVRDDLVDARMLRLDGDQLAFRHKYVYAFFVAWWIHRNLHKPEAQAVVKELCDRLHYDLAANVLVFLSHLNDNPMILEQMLAASSKLFQDAVPCRMTDDIEPLNTLDTPDGFFALPPTDPEVNRRLIQDAEDDAQIRQERVSHDGRMAKAIPDEDPATEREEIHSRLREVRASIRAMRIFGQVLRNKALSTEHPERVALMEEVLNIGRRALGHLYAPLATLDEMIGYIRKRLLRAMIESKREEVAASRSSESKSPIDPKTIKFKLRELRALWKMANESATRFWFTMYWMVSLAIVRRLANEVGSRDLDPTLARIRNKKDELPIHLVELAARLNRRGRYIPADDLVKLHKALQKSDNRIGRIVLEALVWQRLSIYDTDTSQKQQICTQMGIKVPVKPMDRSRRLLPQTQVAPREMLSQSYGS